MARVRKIKKNPTGYKNYFLVDANFLAEKYIPVWRLREQHKKQRAIECQKWWKEIDRQALKKKARVYVPDICIAEAFKVLAKKYYSESIFKTSQDYKSARKKLSKDITVDHKVLKAQQRHIKYHDMPTSRDIIIAVDRFYELFLKHNKNVSVNDLIVVATAKYLMDFHDAKREQLHIITMDQQLRDGIKKITEIPNAYDPSPKRDLFDKIFE